MAFSCAARRQLLAANSPQANEVRLELQDYLGRTGMAPPDFAHRINYSRETVYHFLSGHYSRISSNDGLIRAAIRDFIAAHPDCRLQSSGQASSTKPRMSVYCGGISTRHWIIGGPITSTAPREPRRPTYSQHLIAELNCSEIAKNGEGRRAYYVYVRQGIHSLDLMKRVAQSCGALGMGTVDRILRNLRFDLEPAQGAVGL